MTLFNSILGQQISVAAAKSIKNKISTNFDINPKSLSNANTDKLRELWPF